MTIAYWRYATYLCVESKWLLLLPIYRDMFMGIVANVAAEEIHREHPDYAVYQSILSSVAACVLIVYAFYPTTIIAMLAAFACILCVIVRISINYLLLSLHSMHAGVLSLFSWLPFMMFIYSVMLKKFEEESYA